MSLAQPLKAWWFAALTTITSVIGGVFGYLLGMFMFNIIEPWLHQLHYWEKYLTVSSWFQDWGFWAILIAGFSPIPYKLFTIAAGTIAMPLVPFVVASALGRGARFFLVAGLMRLGGQRFEQAIRIQVERLGWLSVALLVGVFVVYNLSGHGG